MRGIGTDIIEIARIAESLEKHGDKFSQRICTPAECAYCDKFTDRQRHYAGRFAAKEAVAKALGCGFGKKLGFHDIEILQDEHGAPQVTLQGQWKGERILLSISHCEAYATATAIRL